MGQGYKRKNRKIRKGWRENRKVNTRDVPREQHELIGEFKMAASDVISIKG